MYSVLSVLSCCVGLGDYLFYSPPAVEVVHVPQDVECRCVVENSGDSFHSELVGVLKKQLDRCGPEHQTCAACPVPHPCPDCPSCPVSLLPHYHLDFTSAMLAAFLAGMFSGCSSLGCCVRPWLGQHRAYSLATSPSPQSHHLPARQFQAPAIEDFGPQTAPVSFPAGVLPPGQGLGSTPLRRRLVKSRP